MNIFIFRFFNKILILYDVAIWIYLSKKKKKKIKYAGPLCKIPLLITSFIYSFIDFNGISIHQWLFHTKISEYFTNSTLMFTFFV